jgi:hypothetical protein
LCFTLFIRKKNHFTTSDLSLITSISEDYTAYSTPSDAAVYLQVAWIVCVSNTVRKLTRKVHIEYSSILTLVRRFTQFLQSNTGRTSNRPILLPLHITNSLFGWHSIIRRYSSWPTDGVVKQTNT